MERQDVGLPITERTFSGTCVLALRAIQRRLQGSGQPLNVILEVGRDPLRVPEDTPADEILDAARALATAKRSLETVLPQATRR